MPFEFRISRAADRNKIRLFRLISRQRNQPKMEAETGPMTEQAHGECRRKSDRPRVTSWLERLRARIVEYGIEAVCGASASISASAARDVPVLSAALQMGWLRALRACGMRRIIATSAMGHRFVCH